MGGGKNEEVCLIAHVGTNSEPYVLDLRKALPDITFIYYDRKPIQKSEDWFRQKQNKIPDGMTTALSTCGFALLGSFRRPHGYLANSI